MIYFLLEPHESLNEDIVIISDNDNDAADEDKEEELVIFFFLPFFHIFIEHWESFCVNLRDSPISNNFSETIIQILPIPYTIPTDIILS